MDEDKEHLLFQMPAVWEAEVDFGKDWERKHCMSGCWSYIMVTEQNILKGALCRNGERNYTFSLPLKIKVNTPKW